MVNSTYGKRSSVYELNTVGVALVVSPLVDVDVATALAALWLLHPKFKAGDIGKSVTPDTRNSRRVCS